MPPIPRISKEQVLTAGFEIVREQGIEVLNARYLAKALECSTQPIFRVYDTMESLKQDIFVKAEQYYNQKMMQGLEHPVPFLGMGLAYVEFAMQEKQLFKLIFLNDAYQIHSFQEMAQGEDNDQIIEMIAAATQRTKQQAKNVLVNLWLLMHGMATVIATNTAEISMAEVEEILNKGFFGFLSQEKEGINHDQQQ